MAMRNKSSAVTTWSECPLPVSICAQLMVPVKVGAWAGSSGVTGETVVRSQVQGFVGVEYERHGGVDPFGSDVGSVEGRGCGAALAHSAAVASEFHPSVSAAIAQDPTTPDPVAPGGRSIPEVPLSAAPQGSQAHGRADPVHHRGGRRSRVVGDFDCRVRYGGSVAVWQRGAAPAPRT